MVAIQAFLASLGGAPPLVVIIGMVLIVVGVVMLFRRSILMGRSRSSSGSCSAG
jgi:xanthosine utilization system XapX-like protein